MAPLRVMRLTAALLLAARPPCGGAISSSNLGPVAILQGPAPEQEKHLRVCNGYAHQGALDVTLERTGAQLSSLQYKECSDLSLLLREGDLLSFFLQGPKVPRLGVGSFAISGLPTTVESPLLLAVQKHSGNSLRAVFQSHAFAEPADSAQVAVMDTYQQGATSGVGKALHIAEVSPGSQAESAAVAEVRKPPQELTLNSVVSVNPGQYQVSLGDEGEGLAPTARLSAEPRASYVVLRVGGSAALPQDASVTFPEEVVVFPQPTAPERSTFASMLASASTWVKGLIPN